MLSRHTKITKSTNYSKSRLDKPESSSSNSKLDNLRCRRKNRSLDNLLSILITKSIIDTLHKNIDIHINCLRDSFIFIRKFLHELLEIDRSKFKSIGEASFNHDILIIPSINNDSNGFKSTNKAL